MIDFAAMKAALREFAIDASIEAANPGAAGKGFAVVAQRSAT